MELKIPKQIENSLRIPESEVKGELIKELALSLYQRGALSLGKARELAGMSKWSFQEELRTRRVIRHYREEDLKDDIAFAKNEGS